jgi:hypothetical protein
MPLLAASFSTLKYLLSCLIDTEAKHANNAVMKDLKQRQDAAFFLAAVRCSYLGDSSTKMKAGSLLVSSSILHEQSLATNILAAHLASRLVEYESECGSGG